MKQKSILRIVRILLKLMMILVAAMITTVLLFILIIRVGWFGALPDHLVKALIATEDARFYRHHGIDSRATLRVILKSVILRNPNSGGGSTLSQQLAKNLFPRKDYGLLSLPVAKVREVLIALRLEKIYSKNELLELYLNTVSFGENTYGIETASLTFFSKYPDSLTIEESAMLVGSSE